MLVLNIAMAAVPDGAPDPVRFVPGPGSAARILLPDRDERYALNRLTEPDTEPGSFLRLLLPGAVVHEDTEWTVRHGGIVSSRS
ncbi:hypothetical protein [Streptomyces sp. NPDC002104]